MAKIAKNSGSIAIMCFLLAVTFVTALISFTAIESRQSYKLQVTKLAEQAARSGAALINTAGERVATETTNNILTSFSNKTITIRSCPPYQCLEVIITYEQPFGGEPTTVTIVAASYSDQTRVGAFLLP